MILSLAPLFCQKMAHCSVKYDMNFCFPIKCVKDVVLNALLKILPSFTNVTYPIDMILMLIVKFWKVLLITFIYSEIIPYNKILGLDIRVF